MERPEWGIKLSKLFIIPQRYILAIMGCISIVVCYTMRVCLSMAITKLVVPREYTEHEISSSKVCPKHPSNVDEVDGPNEGFEWSQELQGMILGSFYIGYVILHIPGGVLADKFGGKYVLSLGVLLSALFTLITPITINMTGAIGLITLRVLTGASQGTIFPALSVLLARWAPSKERAILGTIVLGGGQLGTLVGVSSSGYLLHHLDWHWVFYCFGAFGIVWFILFTVMCFNDPGSHPYIKQSELDYLRAEMSGSERTQSLLPIPWGKILTSMPVWALIWAQIGHDWGFFAMNTDLPKYLNDVLQFSIKSNGLYSSLPFLAMWIVSLFWALLTDCVITREYFSITFVRKFNTTLAAVGPGVMMVLASYLGCDYNLVVIAFIVCMALMGPYYSGMKLGPLDMSPNYSGTLMALANGIGGIMGLLAPLCIGFMTPNTSLQEWRIVFWFSFGILTGTSVIYCIWASGEVQPFDSQNG